MAHYDGYEGEAFRDAQSRYASRSESPIDLAPGLMTTADKIKFQASAKINHVFPVVAWLGMNGKVLQNADGSWPSMPGYDGPATI